MKRRRALLLLLPAALAPAKEKKLSTEDRLALLRGLTAEYAKAKVLIPRSKKHLPIEPNGKWDTREIDYLKHLKKLYHLAPQLFHLKFHI